MSPLKDFDKTAWKIAIKHAEELFPDSLKEAGLSDLSLKQNRALVVENIYHALARVKK